MVNDMEHSALLDGLVLAVAPTAGRFQAALAAGRVRAGEVIGHVVAGATRRAEVLAPVDAAPGGLLVRDGQQVMAGQAVVWMTRGAA